jgi:hypothetical protein
MLDYRAIIRAGKSLALAGLLDIAKAFFETAYLSDESGAFRQEHYSLVQRTSIWPTTHLSELVRARANRADRRAMPVRVRLQRLIALTAAGEGADQDDAALDPPTAREASSASQPEVLDRDRSESVLKRLTDAVDRAYRAFSVETPISAVSVIEGVRGLQHAASPSQRMVTFPSDGTVTDLRLVAAGILNGLVRRWLRDNVSRFLGAYVRPEQIAAELSLGGNPLSQLAEELGPPAVFDEIDRQLPPSPAGVANVSNASLDKFFCRLAATGAPALSEAQLEEFLQEAMRRRLGASVAVLAQNWVAARPSSGRITACAQR